MLHHLKASASPTSPLTFVVSTGDVNRKRLQLSQDGWDLEGFRQNPIALWMHNPQLPIGTWKNIRAQGGLLMADLVLAAKGTSEFIDTLWSLVEQNIVKAASVGFAAKDYKLDKNDVVQIRKMELREISLVSVPGDASALKLVTLSAEMQDRIFTRPPGKSAVKPQARNTNMTLAERIKALQIELAGKKDMLQELSDKDDLNDDELEQLTTLAAEAEGLGGKLSSLQSAEKALALSATGAINRKTPAQVKAVRKPAELLFRSALVIARAKVDNRSVQEVILNDFSSDKEPEAITLAASNPATTTVAGWASELIEQQLGDFMNLLRPEAVFPNMGGVALTFDTMGGIKLPGRTARGLNGDFVGEGAPIPVKQGALVSVNVLPYKMAVISTFTRELAKRSTPAAEALIRQMMIEDTAVTLDTRFLDNVVGSAIRPAGMQVLAGANTAASSGNTLANIITDARAAVEAMTTNNLGRRLVWTMNTNRRLGLMMVQTAVGDFMFQEELLNGTWLGIPVVHSITVPSSVVFLTDAGELVQADGGMPEIDVSEQATLHMEDTTPLPLVTGTQGSGVVATPMRSLFQTASLGLRLILDVSWAIRNPLAVRTITGVAW